MKSAWKAKVPHESNNMFGLNHFDFLVLAISNVIVGGAAATPTIGCSDMRRRGACLSPYFFSDLFASKTRHKGRRYQGSRIPATTRVITPNPAMVLSPLVVDALKHKYPQ